MEMTMKIEKQSSKFIKPFIQTLPTLSTYKLGFIDEFAPNVDVGIALFFSTNTNHTPNFVARLENSLAKMLTRLYPLAGRYVEETRSVNCNDQGVEFIHAKVDIKLQDFLVSKVNVKFIDEFIPSKIWAPDQQSDPLLATQVTTFECGGVAIGVTAPHKIIDASTLSTIINEWALSNREENESEFTRPGFNSSTLFPPRGLSSLPIQPGKNEMLNMKYTKKKLSFNESVISKVKAKGKNSTRRWSKVQIVSAIIWKIFMDVDVTIHNQQRESVLIQPINLREKMGSLIPKDSCGNLWGICVTECETPETTIEVLTDRLSDSVTKIVNDFSKGHRDRDEGQELVLNSLSRMSNVSESTNLVAVTSWCKFPFYKADFGFGKPVWAVPGTMPANHSAWLLDDVEGNGVEAFVFLEVKDVPYFEDALKDIYNLL